MGEVNARTAHPCTLTNHHAQNRILKRQPPCTLLALRLSNPIAHAINSTNVPSKATSSSKEHVWKRFAAACAVIGPAYDVGGTKVTVYKDKLSSLSGRF